MAKYKNVPEYIDGIRFASKAEARRYRELRLLEQAGEIYKLKVHKKWPIEVYGHHITTWTDDFSYYDKGGKYHVEDVKGFRTQRYSLIKKLMKAVHSIEIEEVEA